MTQTDSTSDVAVREPWLRTLFAALASQSRQAGSEASEDAVVDLASALLIDAQRERATDIHLDPQQSGVQVRFRVDGAVLKAGLIGSERGRRLINQFKTLGELDPVATFAPQDARLTYDVEGTPLDLRIAAAPCIEGEKLAIRIQSHEEVEQHLDALGLESKAKQKLSEWLEVMEGLLVVAGPTASGKTTTLYALLQDLKGRDRSIITIEDPVEYRVDDITQMQVDEEHDFTFAEGIKAMLRLDPDYLLVGETRDAESARAAIDAAASGRPLFTTLHARDAVGSVTSLRNWDIYDHELAALLQVVIGQRLVRKLCPKCREQQELSDAQRRWLCNNGFTEIEHDWRACGCDDCNQLGYHGRTGLFEVWRIDEDDAQALLTHSDERAIRERLQQKDHEFIGVDAAAKLRKGVTNIQEIRAVGGLVPPSP